MDQRNLHDVIGQLLEIIPTDETALRSQLENARAEAAPEALEPLDQSWRWLKAARALASRFPVGVAHNDPRWMKQVIDIWLDRKAPHAPDA